MRNRKLLVAVAMVVWLVVPGWGSAAGQALPDPPAEPVAALSKNAGFRTQHESGAASFRDENFGTGLTECPHAGEPSDKQPKPLDRRQQDKVEQLSNGGDDRRVNQDYACFPQNETSIDVNPLNPRNAVAGANDYRLGWGTSGFFATTDNGNHWYDGIIPFPSLPSGDNLDGGGDPAITYDRAGVAYYIDINFNRTDDTNGIFSSRSTNGGFTWTRPCVPIDSTPADPTDDQGRCGGAGDPRHPGDGVVIFQQDNDQSANGSVPFNDKEYVAAGRRPAGVEPTCFGAFTRNPRPCPAGTVSPDRLHVTWTQFTDTDSKIYHSYSDDRGRSWSPPRAISGNAPFCTGGAGSACDLNQFSTPTVNPTTGWLFVSFENFNTPHENQYLLVRSRDGGQTFEGPFFITPVYDVNYPRSGSTRPDCGARGQQSGRRVLTNSCFRVNSGGNVQADPRAGEFADDLYLVMSDNRNGTRASSNTDVFMFASKDGGSSWIGPTRVNNDPSRPPVDRDCGVDDPGCAETFGNDQWFPWVDVSERGDINVNFYDRRLDTASTASEWPTSRQRPGNYLVWRFGAVCTVTVSASQQCLAPEAQPIPQPVAPIDPGSEPQPGQNQSTFPLRNFTLSDNPSNWDYSFRAGIFAGDYDVVAIGPDDTAWGIWTDARNGRSSREQAGRNPACEQADAFLDTYSARSGGSVDTAKTTDALYLVTPCPTDAVDPGAG